MKFKTTIISIIAFLITGSVVLAADNLYEWYSEHGLVLPSISDRPYSDAGIDNDLAGTEEGNIALLNFLENNNKEFGITVPKVTALFEDNLQAKVSSSATTMTLVSGVDDQGVTLSGTYGFVLDEGTSIEEFIICTASGTALSGCLRGIDLTDGKTEVTALQEEHRRGASAKITNFPILAILGRLVNGDEGFPNLLFYDNNADFSTATRTALITKAYADALAIAGVPTSTYDQIGSIQNATRIQQASTTASSTLGAPLGLLSANSSSTPSAETPGLFVVVSENDGKLNQLWLDLSENWIFAANVTTTGQLEIDGLLQVDGNASSSGQWTFSSPTYFAADVDFEASTTTYKGVFDGTPSTTADFAFNFLDSLFDKVNYFEYGISEISSGGTNFEVATDTNQMTLIAGAGANDFVFVTHDTILDMTKDFSFEFHLDANDLSDHFAWFGVGCGFPSCSGTSNTDPAAWDADGAGFVVYAQASILEAFVGNGSNHTTSTNLISNVTITDNNSYKVKRVGGEINFYINDVLLVSLTTNLPDDTSDSIKFNVTPRATDAASVILGNDITKPYTLINKR